MDILPTFTCDFGGEQRAAFALSGTIGLPSPSPAAARIYIGIMPKSESGDAAPRFFLKLVERIGFKLIVTRFVELDDVRAVRIRSGTGEAGDPWTWSFQTAEALHGEIQAAKVALEAAARDGAAYELPFSAGHEGVVYVPETAPVLVRTEYGVPAAEAAEAAHLARRPPCPCCAIGPSHDES
ncbi:MAG: hypothetical protein WKF75_02790 [Singulisphaera sp.]